MDVSSAGDSSTADLHVAGAPKALLVTVHSQRKSDGAVIVDLEEVEAFKDTSGAISDEPNNILTLAQVVHGSS